MNIAKRPPQMNWVYENPKAEIKIAVIPLRNVYNGESTHAIIFVDIGSKSYETAVLSLDECCRYKKLMESLQLMPDLSAKEKKKAGEVLRRSIIQQQKEGELPLYFDKNGCYCLPNKSWVAVEGDTTIGINPQICYVIDPQVEKLKLLRTNNAQPVTRLLKSIYNEPDELYLLVSYSYLSLVLSAIRGCGIEFQAVGWVYGEHGCGKTVAAKRLGGIFAYANNPKAGPALLFDAGATLSSTRELTTIHRDQLLIIDDIAYSASSKSQEKRMELSGQLIREGANGNPISRNPGGKLSQQQCIGGILFTAELLFGKASDVERCILIPITRQLHLPNNCTPALSGSAAHAFLCMFVNQGDNFLYHIKEELQDPPAVLQNCNNQRVRTNLTVLRCAFKLLLDAAEKEGMPPEERKTYQYRLDAALNRSLSETQLYLNRLAAYQKRASIPAILWNAYQKDRFALVNKKKKLEERLSQMDGADLDDGYLCLRKAALETCVRQQPGYQNCNINDIVKNLTLYNILYSNEKSTYQVHIGNDPKLPRVYKLDLEALEKAAKTADIPND